MARPAAAAEDCQSGSRRRVGAAVVGVCVREVAGTGTAVLVPDEGLARQLQRDVWWWSGLARLVAHVLQSDSV